MGRANAVGGALSMLTAILWLVVFVAHWSFWIGAVASLVTAVYWSFGRRIFFPTEFPPRVPPS